MIRNSLKHVLLRLCNGWSSVAGQEVKPVVLMYHTFDTTSWKYGVSPEELLRQLTFLKNERTLLPLSDIVDWVRGEKDIANNAVAITIDDGYADTYEIFFPLAKKYQLPFTLFLTTDLRSQSKLGNLPRPTIAHIAEMLDSGLMTLGLHGHTHVNFPEVLTYGLTKEEIESSEQFMRDHFDVVVDMVAYPAGRGNQKVFAYFQSRGYQAGCTTHAGCIARGMDPLCLPRIGVDRATTMALFKGRLRPGYTMYLRIIRWFKKFL